MKGLKSAVLALLVSSLISQFLLAQTVQRQKMAVPAYFRPDTHSALWTRLKNAAEAEIAIMNPNSGPGSSADAAYTTLLANRGNLEVLGYVASWWSDEQDLKDAIPQNAIAGQPYEPNVGRGNASEIDNSAELLQHAKFHVDNYKKFYPGIDGIFIDQVSVSCDRTSLEGIRFYEDLAAHIKSTLTGKKKVVINPGRQTGQCYNSIADHIVNFEDTSSQYQSNYSPNPTWVQNESPNKFWHLVHNASHSEMESVINASKNRNAGLIYVTDDVLTNPWDTLPSEPYWSWELAKIRGFEQIVSFNASVSIHDDFKGPMTGFSASSNPNRAAGIEKIIDATPAFNDETGAEAKAESRFEASLPFVKAFSRASGFPTTSLPYRDQSNAKANAKIMWKATSPVKIPITVQVKLPSEGVISAHTFGAQRGHTAPFSASAKFELKVDNVTRFMASAKVSNNGRNDSMTLSTSHGWTLADFSKDIFRVPWPDHVNSVFTRVEAYELNKTSILNFPARIGSPFTIDLSIETNAETPDGAEDIAFADFFNSASYELIALDPVTQMPLEGVTFQMIPEPSSALLLSFSVLSLIWNLRLFRGRLELPFGVACQERSGEPGLRPGLPCCQGARKCAQNQPVVLTEGTPPESYPLSPNNFVRTTDSYSAKSRTSCRLRYSGPVFSARYDQNSTRLR